MRRRDHSPDDLLKPDPRTEALALAAALAVFVVPFVVLLTLAVPLAGAATTVLLITAAYYFAG